MRRKKHITKLPKIIRRTVCILCAFALCLPPSVVSNAETDLIQNRQNGLTFAPQENDGDFLFYGGENAVIGDSVFENAQIKGRMLIRMTNGSIGGNTFKNTVITSDLLIDGAIDTINAVIKSIITYSSQRRWKN